MSSARGPPKAPGLSRNDTVNAPFPRANNTARLSLSHRFPAAAPPSSTTSSGASNRVPPIAMPNRNIPALLPPLPPLPPRTGGTMGPPPPPPARRRNAKFDQMFYTSPLPRSISKAYNDLQAAGGRGGAAVGTTTMVPSTLRTGVTTTAVTRSSPRGQAVGAAGKENVVTTTVTTRVVPTPAAATNTDTVSFAATNGMAAAYTAATTAAAEKNNTAMHRTVNAPVAEAEKKNTDRVRTVTAMALITTPPAAEKNNEVMYKAVTTAAPVVTPPAAAGKNDTAMFTGMTAIAEPDNAVPGEPQDSLELAEPVGKRTQGMDVTNGDRVIETPTTVTISDSMVPAPPPVRSFAEAWAEEDDAFMRDVSDDDKDWHPSAAQNKSKSKPNKNISAVTTPVKQGTKRANSSSSRQMPPKKVARTVAASSPGQIHTRRVTGRKSAKTPAALISRGVRNIKLKPNGTSKSPLVNKAEKKKQESQLKHLSPQKNSNHTPDAPSYTGRAGLPGFHIPPGILAETGSAWDPGSGRRLSRRVSAGAPSPHSVQPPSRIITNETGSVRETRSEQRPLSRHVSMGMASTPAPSIPSPASSDHHDVVNEDEIRAPADTPAAKETPIRKTPKNFLGTSSDNTNAVEKEAQQVDSNTPIVTSSPRRSTRSFLPNEQAPDSDAQISTPDNQPEKQAHTDTHITTPTSRRSTRITPTTKKTPLSKLRFQDISTAVQSPIPPPTPPPFPLKKMRRSLRGLQDLPSVFPAALSEVNKTPFPTLRTPQSPLGPVSNVEVVIKTPQPRARVRATRASTARKKQVNPEFEFSDGELS